MLEPRNSGSSRKDTFQQRIEKIQNVITKFVKENKSGRSETQVWESNDHISSSGGPNTARHHLIPGETFRDMLMLMLSNQQYWPYMVQMLNAALENLRHHKSSTKIHEKFIDNAQDALNMLDERITDCNFDIDSFYEALEDLYAVFYWSPFNIYYGPLPHLRAPADPGNRRDEALSPGINFITTLLSKELEDKLIKSEITVNTVVLYMQLLILNPMPKLTGSYRVISPTLEHFVENYVKYELQMKPNTKEFDDKVNEINTDQVFFGDLRTSLLKDLFVKWLRELENVGACNGCKDNALRLMVTEENDNVVYKCQNKLCPFFSAQPKYALHSDTETSSVNEIGTTVTKLFISDKFELKNDSNTDKLTAIIADVLQVYYILICGEGNIEDLNDFESRESAKFVHFLFLTEDLDYEYKKLKEILMEGKL